MACEKFGCLPSQLYREDAELIRLLNIVDRGSPEQDEAEYPDYEEEGEWDG